MDADSEPPVNEEQAELAMPRYFLWRFPDSIWRWCLFIPAMCLLGYGLIWSLYDMDKDSLAVAVIGALVASIATPGSLSGSIKKAAGGDIGGDVWNVEPIPPMNSEDWHLDRKYWNEDEECWMPNPLARYEQDGPRVSVEQDGESWTVLVEGKDPTTVESAEEADKLMMEEIKDADSDDAQELVFSEHPRHNRFRAMYNETPPLFSTQFLWQAIAIMILFSMWLATPKEIRSSMTLELTGIMVFGFAILVVSHHLNKRALEAWDTVTSIVKYLDAGHNELVGQVRPADFTPIDVVHVDGYRDKSWTFHDLVAWRWDYTPTVCWKETYVDSKGNVRTRTVCRSETIRADAHVRDFLLHDGSGGVAVDLGSFEDVSYGNSLMDETEPGKQGGNPLHDPGSGKWIRNHAWSLSGLKLGEPVYAMARIKDITNKENLRGMVSENSTRLHHNLVAMGEDAPRRHAKVRKGSELSLLKARRSSVDVMGFGTLLILSHLIIMSMSI